MKRLNLLSVIFALTVGNLFGQNIPEQLESIADSYYEKSELNGTILVADCDQILFEKSYGLANTEKNISNNIDTKFMIG